MTPEQLVYWLNGFFELSAATTLNEQQVQVIKEHIALVMTKVTPSSVGTPITPIIYPYLAPSPILDKGWEITCNTDTSGTSLTIPPFPTSSVVVCPNAWKTGDSSGHFCSECKVYPPIVNVKTCLTC